MKFLVISKPTYPVPLEIAVDLNKAMMAWIDEHTKSGKIEASWAFSGLSGGGGIFNVDSLDELDTVMMGFPFAPFSEMEIFGLSDLAGRLERWQAMYEAMAAG